MSRSSLIYKRKENPLTNPLLKGKKKELLLLSLSLPLSIALRNPRSRSAKRAKKKRKKRRSPMARDREEHGAGGSGTGSGPDAFLIVCRTFSVITGAVALLSVAVNVLSAVLSFKNGYDIFGGIFRCYVVLIALFVAVAETEWSLIFKFCRVLEYWPGRGMLQIFVAVMTRAFPDFERRDLMLLQEIACYLLLACGFIYVILGVLCIGYLKRKRQQRETSRDQAIKDLEQLERRRDELQALLVAERS